MGWWAGARHMNIHSCIMLSNPVYIISSVSHRFARWKPDVRITLNRRAETAAPAIVKRMITRRRPLVFLLVEPLR